MEREDITGIKAFRDNLSALLQIKLGANFTISKVDAPKQNAGLRYGISIRRGEDSMAPCVYLEQFYQAFRNGDSLDELAREILAHLSDEAGRNIDWNWLLNLEQAKEKITPRLINTEKNADFLETVPYVPFLNLSCVFYLMTPKMGENEGYISVTNALLETWGISADVLYRQAIRNTVQQEILLVPLSEVLGVFLPETTKGCADDIQMYMLTGEKIGEYGASVILSEQVREQIKDRFGQNMYLLPASVHEWLLVPADKGPQELLELVKWVNQSTVESQDWLADNVYQYHVADGSISIVA